jgi:hypothetical protein
MGGIKPGPCTDKRGPILPAISGGKTQVLQKPEKHRY